jgi:hypothetical protein
MRSAPSFWEGAKKEALDNAKKAVAELNELGFHYTLMEGASASNGITSTSASQSSLSSPEAPSEGRSLPHLPFQNDATSRWADASVTEGQEGVHCRGINGAPPSQGWLISL